MLTWRQILQHLNAHPEKLDEPAQIIPYNPANPECVDLQPIVGINTIAYYELHTRSAKDNQSHPEEFCLLVDCNPYSERGDYCHELLMSDDGTMRYKTTYITASGTLEVRDELADEFDLADNNDLKLSAIRKIIGELEDGDEPEAWFDAARAIKRIFAAESAARAKYQELLTKQGAN